MLWLLLIFNIYSLGKFYKSICLKEHVNSQISLLKIHASDLLQLFLNKKLHAFLRKNQSFFNLKIKILFVLIEKTSASLGWLQKLGQHHFLPDWEPSFACKLSFHNESQSTQRRTF